MNYSGKWDREGIDYRALRNQWHVVARADEVRDGAPLPVRLLGEELVLWRGPAGINAWKDYCGHRGAKLSLGCVRNGEIECPYHGWRYSEHGRCVKVPAHPDHEPPQQRLVFPHRVTERYGLVWVSLGQPEGDVPAFPEWDDPSFRKVYAGPYRYRANALRSVENFLDASHFPFVHANLNGDPDNPDPIDDYDVFKTPQGLKTSEITVFQPYGDHRGIPVTARYTYHVFQPTTAYFTKKTGVTERFCTFLNATPADEDEAVLYLIVAINFGADLTEAQILDRQDRVFEQDRRIVESQRPYRLPLDLREEMHVRSDRLAVEYRRWLKALGEAAPSASSPLIPVQPIQPAQTDSSRSTSYA
ncbi:TPA: Rieske 2Fe-2S domain-containing protein [Burkholderia cepacia]|uniref:Aromatic ring-hydroxylating dioxygenase subunit alpha n=1 Tax=Burkholderia cepacia TaxID=292 RepID=A0AAQ0FE44_BURCE|nr:aromatic ring-hydroxylating dioxygenase subunit alpha [Burkholderia cepacia]HDR9762846.1 aromatic ring-hydroxylating dioxygenase subunit alpha [Burkholderia cepacia ATCC 25416]MBY4713738.1 aromatic ring-hydroxylating dioxygenase subunit alpha [Burkholderia cepacia]MBY4739841.1 aromatic ring-hydroxylating dioxygenase subunit alpha [Burkholderia cepacia]MBY4747914.1 aromatic ring-hydroxylating dioxygenase subunit alpha [Burkholderia cepacia]MBY4762708.1 aromatic ring-hydroxylating dioxygenase